MKPRPATSPVRRFLRGLANTAAYLLLPCQLALLWFVTREGPLELPGMVARALEERCAEAGGRLHARRVVGDVRLRTRDGVEHLAQDELAPGLGLLERLLAAVRLAASDPEGSESRFYVHFAPHYGINLVNDSLSARFLPHSRNGSRSFCNQSARRESL